MKGVQHLQTKNETGKEAREINLCRVTHATRVWAFA